MIKQRMLTEVGDYPGLSGGAQCNHRAPCRRQVGESEPRMKCDDGSRGGQRGVRGDGEMGMQMVSS